MHVGFRRSTDCDDDDDNYMRPKMKVRSFPNVTTTKFRFLAAIFFTVSQNTGTWTFTTANYSQLGNSIYFYWCQVIFFTNLTYSKVLATAPCAALYPSFYCHTDSFLRGDRGSTVVKLLCYKSEGRWFNPSWCHWNFPSTQPLTEMRTRSISWG